MNSKRMSEQIDNDLKEAFITRDNNNDQKYQTKLISNQESTKKISESPNRIN